MAIQKIELPSGEAYGYVVELKGVNLVFAVAGGGMLGCGAFNVMVLDKFDYPAATVRSTDGTPIASIGDLLAGEVNAANEAAERIGVRQGLRGREALELM